MAHTDVQDANKSPEIIDDRVVSNFSFDDDNLNDDIAEFDMNDLDIETGNPEIDYYPGMQGGNGRHAFLGEPESFKHKIRRSYRKFMMLTASQNFRKLLVGLGGMCVVIVFFAFMFFSGAGDDSNVPGGAIHRQKPTDLDNNPNIPMDNNNDNNNNENDNNNNNNGYYGNGVNENLVKMSLDDMRKGSYYVFDYDLNFIDYIPDSDSNNSNQKRDDDGDDHKDDANKDEKHENDEHDDEQKNEDEKDNEDEKNHKVVLPNNDLGYYIHQSGNVVWLKQAAEPEFTEKIIDLGSLTYNSAPLHGRLISINKSLNKLIVSTESQQQWRYSSFAKYWLVDVKSLKVEPVYYLTKHENDVETIIPLSLSYAAFSPDGKFIYFNYEGNLFLKNIENNKIIKVTEDGDLKNIINGKPDWVYEEEVLASDRAIYWNSDNSKMAFLKWNDADVPVYNLEIFKDDKYPQIHELKYPKPGFPNPKVSLYVYNLEKSKLVKVKQPEETDKNVESLGEDFIIYQTVWLNEFELLFKRTDRSSRKIQVCVYDIRNGKSSIIRSINTDLYDGWYKNNGNIFVLPNNKGYIDNVVYENHDHLSYFKDSSDAEGDIISSGTWDVIGGVIGFDEIDNSIYFIGTSGNALQRQIYKIKLDDSSLIGLTALDEIHSYSLKVSKGGKWGLIKYAGPDLPSQKLVELNRLSEGSAYTDSISNFNNAHDVATMLEGYAIPFKEYMSIQLHDGVSVNVLEVKPSNFDENKKYPVLVSVYGGPGIQKVSCDFNYGFEEIVSSSLDAIVLYVDPRGTGGTGWKYRSWARNRIGYWEPRDITEATEIYINERNFIDKEKVAIWGWSYGGFSTLKTLEFDKGEVFKFGMAVAPVTDWYLYDSIYTERYMGTPSSGNPYKDSKVSNVKNFSNLYRFLIMHGTADDNVHYQNTLQLLNAFDLNGIENYDVHIFPDSDHSISHDNANTIVYDKLFNWLATAFDV
jgi:dipeptidyl aminopeptidase/acylaminoacyl peptidase